VATGWTVCLQARMLGWLAWVQFGHSCHRSTNQLHCHRQAAMWHGTMSHAGLTQLPLNVTAFWVWCCLMHNKHTRTVLPQDMHAWQHKLNQHSTTSDGNDYCNNTQEMVP